MKLSNVEKLKATDLQSINLRRHGPAKGSKTDYITVYKDFCRNNYAESYKTRLYREYGGEYCSLLELLSEYYQDHRYIGGIEQ